MLFQPRACVNGSTKNMCRVCDSHYTVCRLACADYTPNLRQQHESTSLNQEVNMTTQKQWRNILFLTFALALSLAIALFAREPIQADTAAQTFLPLLSTPEEPFKLFVFTKTEGFRHSSIDDGVTMMQDLANEHNFIVETGEDAAVFTDAALANYAAVVFLSTTGDILNAEQEAAFERYIQAGGGFVGIHAATDTEYDWPWYGQLVGTYFNGHPEIQGATLNVIDTTHISTNHLPATWSRTDEWYNFSSDPSGSVNVLITIDESSYSGGNMGSNHPISWYHTFDGGRSWYTAMGHTSESYSEADFKSHVLGGVLWAATGDASRLVTAIEDEPNEPAESTEETASVPEEKTERTPNQYGCSDH